MSDARADETIAEKVADTVAGTVSDALDEFRRLPLLRRVLRARKRTLFAVIAGLVALLLLPSAWPWTTRVLVAWDVAMVLYLFFAFWTFSTTHPDDIHGHALMYDDGRYLILVVTALAALASLGAIGLEINTGLGSWLNFANVVLTILLSWAAIQTTFAQHYAHEYYHDAPGGLKFGGEDHPDYWDFVYFAFIMGMTASVGDVTVTERRMRRIVLGQAVIAFVFNTALLAIIVNIAADAVAK